ncbi:hypothetical protein [Methylobacterium oryzisoli]|uniref:hypothetical protein n=1 Tax=Methylobacterium oryzisoli TaxID=3385502 RepID=UPI0038928C3B
MRRLIAASVLALACLAPQAVLAPAAAQTPPPDPLGTPAGFSQEIRTVVTFKIPDEVAQSLLPAGWTVSPIAQGPAKGANLSAVFSETLLGLGADGKPTGAPETFAVLSVPAKSGQENAFGIVVVYGGAQAVPGYYRTGKPAQVALARSVQGQNAAKTVEESWTVTGEGGERLNLRIAYEAGQPNRSQFDSRNVSAADPKVRRNYRVDQGTFVIRSPGSSIDRAKSVSFEASGGVLGKIFSGTPEIVSIAALPWYARQMFVPTVTD